MTAATAPDQAPADEKPEGDEAAFWRSRYEEERQRLAKLWVAYKALEEELDVAARPPKAS